jgi:hypothetical protein
VREYSRERRWTQYHNRAERNQSNSAFTLPEHDGATSRPLQGRDRCRHRHTQSNEQAAPPASDPFHNLREQREKKKRSGFEFDPFSINKNLIG